MPDSTISVKPIEAQDVIRIVEYWLNADKAFLNGMGADIDKIPSRNELFSMLSMQLQQDYPEKQSYCTIWQMDGESIGHCNVNKIIFGEEASMHLHIWNKETRMQGLGAELVKLSLPFFFENLQLKMLYSEPYSLNPAPNKTLRKAGFSFVRNYITTPGALNFEQMVSRWEMSREQFYALT